MAFLDFFTGKPAQTQQFERYTPSQQVALDQLLSQGTSGIQNLNQAFDLTPIEREARTQFQTQTVPSIAERFTALGSGPRSSNFIGRLGQAGAGLEQSLASLRSNVGLQQRGQQQNLLTNLLSLGLTPRFETAYQPAQPGFLESAGAPLLQGLGQSLPMILSLLLGGATGGTSAAAGAGLPLLLKLLGGQ
jgi:hypothetical protein